MTIKLLALDLDHTLLNDNREISERDAEAIRAARKKGVAVTIATGRMFSAAHSFAQDLNIDVPIITYQGSIIRKLLSEEDLLHLRLTNVVAKRAIEIAKKADVHINVYDGDRLFVRKDNELVARYKKVNGIEVIVNEGFVDDLKIAPTKLVFIDNDYNKLNKLQNIIEKNFKNNWDITRSFPHLLELGHKQATKSKALEFLCKDLGIRHSNIMAIGDGPNDIDMLRWAGIGIAMGNAPLEVKRIADWVTADNNSNGVAIAIEKYILNKK